MPLVNKRAKDLKIDDILAPARGHGAMSIKEVFTTKNPALGTNEVVVRGPLGFVDKLDENAIVVVLK